MDHSGENKRLAKNTITLYCRTIIVTIISLVISRVLLKNLGVENFGIYNVVGSVVVLFSFLNSALTTSTQRFLTFSLGKKNMSEMEDVFCTSMSIQIILTLVVVIIVEVVGVWFLNSKLNIPDGRIDAAGVAFQFSILTFALNILRIPYNATIIAYERMDIFAYLSIFDIVLKLGISYLICFCSIDRLVFYAALLTIESAVMLLVHYVICNRKFDTCRYHFMFNVDIFKRMFVFTGWSTFGSFSNIATQNGFLFLINIFCGVVVNAAMGIANQVVSALNAFVSSFQTSFYPQIVKAYAQDDRAHLFSLITRTSKFSFELMLIPALVLIVNIDYILNLWLTDVPEYANIFCQMVLVCAMIDAATGPYYCGIMSTGRIKTYQLCISASFLTDVVLVYLMLVCGVSPRYILVSRIITRGLINAVIGLVVLKKLLGYDIKHYLINCVIPIITQILIVSIFINLICSMFNGLIQFCVSFLFISISVILTAFFLVFDLNERKLALSTFNQVKNRLI